MMTGRLRKDVSPFYFLKGDYGKWGGIWYGKPPTPYQHNESLYDLIANLGQHTITEHDDGTITASPSILVRDGCGHSWHGYLNKGVWSEVGECVEFSTRKKDGDESPKT